MLQNIMTLIRNAIIAAINVSRKAAGLALLPLEMVGNIFGGGGSDAPQLPKPPAPKPETEFEKLKQRTEELLKHTHVPHFSEECAYRYACASREERKTMDLSDLESHHKRWLMELNETELDDVKRVGLRALIGHLSYKKFISGVPAPYAMNAEESAKLRSDVEVVLRESHAGKKGFLEKPVFDDEIVTPSMRFA